MTDVVASWLSGDLPDAVFADWLEENGVVAGPPDFQPYYLSLLRLKRTKPLKAKLKQELWREICNKFPYLKAHTSSHINTR